MCSSCVLRSGFGKQPAVPAVGNIIGEIMCYSGEGFTFGVSLNIEI